MRILIPQTRELCYYSSSFFLDMISDGLQKRGHEVIRLDLLDGDFSPLEMYRPGSIDAVIDINSKLPRLIDDDGRCFLDTLEVPFYNYILDHPLYHHRGLSAAIRDYHAIVVDRRHEAYISKWYKNIASVSCIPMGGTKALTPVPYEKRSHDFLFSGTFLDPGLLQERAFAVREDHGDGVYQLMRELYDAWDISSQTMEEALTNLLFDYADVSGTDVAGFIHEEYEARDMAELMNRLYIVDQMKRNKLREDTLIMAAKSGYRISVLGEGWEKSRLLDFDNAKQLQPVPMQLSFEVMADSRALIDVGPLFFCGIHDRVTSGLANGCICITDMADDIDASLCDGRELFYYGRGRRDIGEAIGLVSRMSAGDFYNMGESAMAAWHDRYDWDRHVDCLIRGELNGVDQEC